MGTRTPVGARRVNQVELGKLLGITKQAVGQLVKRGAIEVGSDGRIDVELALHALQNRVRPSAKSSAAAATRGGHHQPPAGDPPDDDLDDEDDEPTDYLKARTLREIANARMDQLRLRKMRGELTEVDKVAAGIFTAARMLRDTVLCVPRRIAADAVATGDASAAERIMTSALRQAFDDFRQMAMARLDQQVAQAVADDSSSPP